MLHEVPGFWFTPSSKTEAQVKKFVKLLIIKRKEVYD